MKKQLAGLVKKAKTYGEAYEIDFKVNYIISGYAVEELGFDTYLEVELYMDGELQDGYDEVVQLDAKGSKAKTFKLAQDVVKYLEGLGYQAKLNKRVDR